MPNNTLALLLLINVGALVYLVYKVNRLERLLEEGRPHRQSGSRGKGKVVPLLKENIEPGPFRKKKDPDEPGPRSDGDR